MHNWKRAAAPLLGIVLATVLGCQDRHPAGPSDSGSGTPALARVLQNDEFETPCDEPTSVVLRDVGGEALGQATIWNGETTAYARLTAPAGWEFAEVRIGGARRADRFPSTGGEVDPSRFPFGGAVEPATDEVVIEALYLGNPYGVEPGDQVLLAIFARLRPADGGAMVEAWAEGIPFRSGGHPMYFGYTVQECEAPPPPRDPVVIGDDTFADSDWEIFQELSLRGGAHRAEQSSADGNPPPHRLMWHLTPRTGMTGPDGNPLPSSINVRHRFVGEGAQYDPAASGAIERIDVRMDRRVIFVSPGGGGAVGHAFLVFQNGVIYWADLGSFMSTSWETRALPGLTASDFTNNAAQHPDFSETGAPLTFGYLRSNSNTGQTIDVEILHGIDNWSVTIHR